MARVAFALAVAAGLQMGQASTVMATKNPIRKVVTMLQNVQKKVEQEGEKEEELYEKFMCYCKTGVSDLEKSIADAEAKIANADSAVKEAEANKKQLDADLVSHKADREDAKKAMAEAQPCVKKKLQPTPRPRRTPKPILEQSARPWQR